jgi:hypothetical protein
MFRRTAIMVALVAITAVTAAATYNNSVEAGVLPLFIGNINALYMRNLTGMISVGAGGGYSPLGYLFVDVEDDITWHYGNVKGVFRFHPLGESRRLYVQVEASGDFHSLKEDSTGETASVTMITPAALIGWRWIIADRATLNVAGGSGYISGDIDVGDEHVDFEGIRPRFDLNLGFAF